MRSSVHQWLGVDGESAAFKNLPFDPRTTATSVQVRVDRDGAKNDSDETFALPAANWRKTSSRYTYRADKGPFNDIKILDVYGRAHSGGAFPHGPSVAMRGCCR
jgi:hypothetical protein